MGYYLIEPDDTPPAGARLVEWVKQNFPDMDNHEVAYHIVNLTQVMNLTVQQLEQALLDDEPLDPDLWDSLDEPPY